MSAHVPPPPAATAYPGPDAPGPALMLRGKSFTVERRDAAGTLQEVVVTGASGAAPFTLHLTSGLLAVVLGSAITPSTLFDLDAEDAGLVAEHLLGIEIEAAERRINGRIRLDRLRYDRLADARDSTTPEPDAATYRFVLGREDADYPVRIETRAGSRLDRFLAALIPPDPEASAPLPGAITGQDAPEVQRDPTSDDVLALGPIVLDADSLERMAPGDLIDFAGGGALTGGLFTGRRIVPVSVDADRATVAAAFGRSAETDAAPGHAKLWLECGSATPEEADRRLVPGATLAWTAFPDHRAWLALDGCRLRVARGRLVDTGGQVAFRIDKTRVSAWA